MKKYLLMCIAISFTACSTLNKESIKAKIAATAQIEQKYEEVFISNAVKLVVDSNDMEEEVVLWPKGIVKYSTVNGFEGELIKMSLRKKNKRQVVRQETQNEIMLATQNLKSKKQEKKLTKSTFTKQKKIKLLGIGTIGFVLLMGVIYLLYKGKLIWV